MHFSLSLASSPLVWKEFSTLAEEESSPMSQATAALQEAYTFETSESSK
jgi:hypothetical protein